MLRICLEQGADAVYLPLSGRLAIRLKRDFFSLPQLKPLIDYTHQQGRLVYVVINGLIREGEFEDYCTSAETLFQQGADGLVVGSVALARWIARRLKPQRPEFKIIASSSMSAISPCDANFLYRQGVDRVIIPRLHTMPQIAYYRKHAEGELEIFVHGLLCPGWEGQGCLLPLFHHPGELEHGCCLPAASPDIAKAPCRQYQSSDQTPLWDFRVQADLAYLPQLVELGIESIKVIAVGKEIPMLAKTIAIWREALDTVLEGKKLSLPAMQQALKQVSPLPLDFSARAERRPCR